MSDQLWPPGSRLLGLFAHPDDELFCVGGTFAQAARHGSTTGVVSFTRGEGGQIRQADLATRKTLGAVRALELTAACDALGVDSSRCLDFGDGRLRDVDQEVLVQAAVEIIREFKPDAVFSFDRTGAYGHSDHIVMSEVSELAMAAAADPHRYPAAGDVHEGATLFHACFPRNDRLLIDLLVQWLTELPDRFRGTADFVTALMMFADGSSMLGYAADKLRVEWYPAGAYIIEQDAEDRDLYLVLSGLVDIVTETENGHLTNVGAAVPGQFIGETAIAEDARRNAHCISAEDTTCFVLSPNTGDEGYRVDHRPESAAPANAGPSTRAPTPVIVNDVRPFVAEKVSALAAHSTQYSMAPGLFPDSMLGTLLGTETFIEIDIPRDQTT